MQRLLVICRHAESNDSFPLQSDFERELTKNGQHQARVTGQWLRDSYHKMDTILCSPAPRAGLTAKLLANRLYFDEEEITYLPELYNARESVLTNSLGNLPDTAKSVLLVGHNPGITSLVRTLTGQFVGYLDPAGAFAIRLGLESWQDIHVKTGRLEQHFTAPL